MSLRRVGALSCQQTAARAMGTVWSSRRTLVSAVERDGAAGGTTPSQDGDIFRRVFPFAASHIDVSPLKRPWLTGSLTFLLAEDVSMTIVRGVEGTAADWVAGEVRRRALLLATVLSPKSAGADDASTSVARLPNPWFFLRQHFVSNHSLLLEQARELDWLVRFALDVDEQQEGASPDASVGDLRVRCAVYVTDPWHPAMAEEEVFAQAAPVDELHDLLTRAFLSLTEQVRRCRGQLLDESIKEAELRVAEVTAPTHDPSRHCGWGSLIVAAGATEMPLHGAIRALSHRRTRQPIAVECTMTNVTRTPLVHLGGSDARVATTWICPLLAIKQRVGDAELIFAEHETLPVTDVESILALMRKEGEVSTNDALATPVNVLTIALDFLKACYPRLADAFVSDAVGPLHCTVPVECLVPHIGWQVAELWSRRRNHRVPCLPLSPFPATTLGALSGRKEDNAPLRLLERALAWDIGWANAPVVRLAAPPSPVERKWESEKMPVEHQDEGAVSFAFPSLLAVSAGEPRHVYALGRVFDSPSAALLAICPSAARSEDSGDGGTDASTELGSTALGPHRSKNAQVTVHVLDVERVLMSRGCRDSSYDARTKRLVCRDGQGRILFEFADMHTLKGLSRLLRFASGGGGAEAGRTSEPRPYLPVPLDPSSTPSTALRRLLCAALSGSTQQRLRRSSSFTKRVSFPIPLSPLQGHLPFSFPVEQHQVVRELLSLLRHYSREPADWPLPNVPAVNVFNLLPITRGALSILASSLTDFTCSFTQEMAASDASPNDVLTVTFTCRRSGGPGDERRREDPSVRRHTAAIGAGAEVVGGFHAALQVFIHAVTSTDGREAGPTSGTGGEEEEEKESGSFACPLPSLEAFAAYAIPGLIKSGSAAHAAQMVVDAAFRSNIAYEEDTAAQVYSLVLSITPSLRVCLTRMPAAEVDKGRSWRARLADKFVREGMPVFASSSEAVAELGGLLDELELAWAVSQASPRRASTPAAVRETVFCRFVEESGQSAGSSIVEVHVGDPTAVAAAVGGGGLPPTQHTRSPLLIASGTNRLEALQTLLPKLRHLVETLSAFAVERAPPTTDLLAGNPPVHPAETATTTGGRRTVYSTLARQVAERHGAEAAHHRFTEATQRLTIYTVHANGEELAIATTACESLRQVPRLLTFLYKEALAVRSPLFAQASGPVTVNFSETQPPTLQKTTALDSYPLARLAAAIAQHLPTPTPYHQLMRLEMVHSAGGQSGWLAALPLPCSTFGAEGPNDEASADGSEAEEVVLAVWEATKMKAARKCLSTLYLWVVEGIPVCPPTPPAPRASSVLRAKPQEGHLRVPHRGRAPAAIFTNPSPTDGNVSTLPFTGAGSAVSGPQVARPERKAKRVTLRADLPHAPAASRRPMDPSSASLAALLSDSAAAALTSGTGVEGTVHVHLSRIFGIEIVFAVVAGTVQATEPSVPHTTLTAQPCKVARGPGRPVATVPDSSTPPARREDRVVLAKEGWAPPSQGVWPPLQVLRCLGAVANGVCREKQAGSMDRVVQAFFNDLEQRVALTGTQWTAQELCILVFERVLGWEVAGVSTTTPPHSPTRPHGHQHTTRVEFVQMQSGIGQHQQRTAGRGTSRTHHSGGRVNTAAGRPFGSGYAARVRLVQVAPHPGAADSPGETVRFALTLAQVEGRSTEEDARAAVWNKCLASMHRTLNLAPGPSVSAAQSVSALCSWLNRVKGGGGGGGARR